MSLLPCVAQFLCLNYVVSAKSFISDPSPSQHASWRYSTDPLGVFLRRYYDGNAGFVQCGCSFMYRIYTRVMLSLTECDDERLDKDKFLDRTD